MIAGWMLLGLLSALLLGMYETAKKQAVHQNAVLPTLLLSVSAGACCMLPILLLNLFSSDSASKFGVQMHPMTNLQHLAVFGKAALVGTSWICAYIGLKHLPLSIASPVRASAPIWTLIGAIAFLGEMPTTWQFIGFFIAIGGYFALSLLGRKEKIVFHRNGWIGLIVLATLLGTASALWDKVLLHEVGLAPITMQVWFSLYLVPFTAVIAGLFWLPQRHGRTGRGTPFQWRWATVMTGVLLILADTAYFYGLAEDDASIALMSAIRRSSVAVSVIAAGLLLKEYATKQKLLIIGGILIGVFCILLGD